MQGLPDNPDAQVCAPVTPCKCPMFSTTQCPKAFAWMASLALAAGQREDAEHWLVEVIGALLFRAYDVPGLTAPGGATARTGIERRS